MRSFRAIASLLAAALVSCGPLAAMFVQPRGPLPGRAGAALANYAYGPFGEAIHATGPAAQANPWRYATKYLDEETGLYYFGLRYYDPVTGQWLSREPLGEGESVNLYSYCHNDPVNKVDVLGSKDFTLADGTIDSSQVHSLLDFVDLMTTDFPLVVYHGLAGLPAQVNQGMAQARLDIDARTDSGAYGPGAAAMARGLQFMGSLSAGVTMAPLQPVDTAVGIVTAPVVLPYNLGESAGDLCTDPSLSSGFDVAENSLNVLLLFEGAGALQGRFAALQNLRVPLPGGLRLPNLAQAGEGAFPTGYQGAPGAMWIQEPVPLPECALATEVRGFSPKYQILRQKFDAYQDAGGQLSLLEWAKRTRGQEWGIGCNRSQFAKWARGHGNSLTATGPHDVYVVLRGGAGEILHFGETGRCFATRLAEHQGSFAELGINIEGIRLQTVEGKAAAKRLELLYIQAYIRAFARRPPFNPVNH